ncbi:heme NO-binding domain-containing protein [Hasllibacter sp. MH4015]|uniref:heme NO-binding domain-containing protein n=1 Tax=Hasllibacter sp. MH4015 TaxID=2854029 RepID=UPI001CD1BF5B|nr:heme NO-binding domain-containing protein [Hasllibacter sp. MH4015]
MHGMINRALQGFLVATYGDDVWAEVRSIADLPFDDFETMLTYDDSYTMACFTAATQVTHQPPTALLEDLGTFLITHPPLGQLRRLLRFGGATFREFILSLDELADRGRMAMPQLEMPEIVVTPLGPHRYRLAARWKMPGIGPILFGAMRAMADDYGALATLRLAGVTDGEERLEIEVHDLHHAAGRHFQLGEVEA